MDIRDLLAIRQSNKYRIHCQLNVLNGGKHKYNKIVILAINMFDKKLKINDSGEFQIFIESVNKFKCYKDGLHYYNYHSLLAQELVKIFQEKIAAVMSSVSLKKSHLNDQDRSAKCLAKNKKTFVSRVIIKIYTL